MSTEKVAVMQDHLAQVLRLDHRRIGCFSALPGGALSFANGNDGVKYTGIMESSKTTTPAYLLKDLAFPQDVNQSNTPLHKYS